MPKIIAPSDVAAYIAAGLPWQQEALSQFHDSIMRAVPTADAAIQYGKPHYSVNGVIVAALHLASGKVSLLMLDAASVPVEKGFIRSMGDGSRKVIDAVEGQSVDVDRVVAALLSARAWS